MNLVRLCGRRVDSRPREQGEHFAEQAIGFALAVDLPCAHRAARSLAVVPI
nr:MAG TPA: hypothetical protein [Caudoviricetes sp.]